MCHSHAYYDNRVEGSLSDHSYKLQYKNDKSNWPYFKFVYIYITYYLKSAPFPLSSGVDYTSF